MKSWLPVRELKKGSAELLILALVEDRARHGYDIGKLIEQRSGGSLKFAVASLYPLLTGSRNAAGSKGDGPRRRESAGAGLIA
jgi:hypothetical protein